MRILVTGSADHLGEALARVLGAEGHDVVGLDLLEAAVAAGVGRFVFTSTTSTFGRALTPPPGAPAAWITEEVAPVPRNIYGATKTAAEDLCELVHRDHGLPCLILRTSRFFPEADDRDQVRARYDDANLKVNELLYRRADLEDVVGARTGSRSSTPRRSASAATSSAPPRRSPATTSPSCAPTPRRSCAGCSRATRRCSRTAAGGCSRASSASTSTRGRGAIWGGRRAADRAPRSRRAWAGGGRGRARAGGLRAGRPRPAAV